MVGRRVGGILRWGDGVWWGGRMMGWRDGGVEVWRDGGTVGWWDGWMLGVTYLRGTNGLGERCSGAGRRLTWYLVGIL
jgi:hypothetical protein